MPARILTILPLNGPPKVHKVERAVVRRINAYRRLHRRRPVTISSHMSVVADAHSRWMARHNRLEHGADVIHRISQAAGTDTVGEVIGFVPRSSRPNRIVVAWLRSPKHRAVLLNPVYRRIGIGRRFRGERAYFTSDFAN